MNIAFAGGGTGGHIFPIKSLVEYIKSKKEIDLKFENIYWFGEKNSLEQKISNSLEYNNLKFIPIISGKIRREKTIKAFLKNIIDVFKFALGVLQSIYLISRYKIDVIFCKGGFVAGPIVFAGWILRKKIFTHESDTVPGLANKFAAGFSDKVFSGFPNVLDGSIEVGQILSDEIVSFCKLDTNGLNLSKTNILVIGGSQGAQTIYETIYNLLKHEKILENYNFFVVLGTQNILFKEKFAEFDNVITYDFLSQKQIGFLFNICDLGITRAGATSLAEQKIFGMKLIIIPLPYTGGNHQYYNGLYYQQKYGDILLNQNKNLYKDLKDCLIDFVGYKKFSPSIESIKKAIEKPKDIIIKNIFKSLTPGS